MTLMQRRRALMGQKSGWNIPTIPGKMLTLQTAFSTGSAMISAINQMMADNSIICPAIIVAATPFHDIVQNGFVGAVVDQNQQVVYPYRRTGDTIENTGSNLGAYDYIADSGDKFYVVSCVTSSVTEETIPGRTFKFAQAITNGQNLATAINSIAAENQIAGPALVITAKPKAEWEIRAFISVAISNGVAYGSGQRWDNSVAVRPLTSTYDFKASPGDSIYVVEVKP